MGRMKKLLSTILAITLMLTFAVVPASAITWEQIADNFELGLNRYNATYCGGYDVDPSSSRENLEEWRQQKRATTSGWPDAHTDQYGKKVWDYADDFNVDDWTGAGEIVANLSFWDGGDSDGDGLFNGTEQIINAWHNSPTHRAIMQTCSYDSFGAGVYVNGSGNVYIGVIYTNQPLKYADETGGVGMWTGAGLCGEERIGVLPYNARLIQYGHKTSSCDGARWYFARYQENPTFTGWVKSSKVRSTP